MSQQKSIEDYRNAVKLLKLKVIKLQKMNEELTDKLREQGIPVASDDGKPQPQLTNQGVMQVFGKSCKRLGLTPEMLFRAADVEGTMSIKVEDFRLFLSKVRLGLNQAQITMIVRILDEDCSGVVKREEYYDCLQAYNINEEKSTTGTRTYGQTSLLKYGRLLLQIQLSAEDSWVKMDPNQSGQVNPGTFSGFVHAIDSSGTMNEKEIVATYNHIDLDKQGHLQRVFYEQEVRKAMKAAAADLGLPQSKALKTGQNFNITRPPNQETLNVPTFNNQDLNQSMSSSMFDAPVEKRIFKIDSKALSTISSKIQAQGVDIIKLIDGLINNLKNPMAGITIYDFFEQFEKMKSKIPKTDQLRLFQVLDVGSNGSIDYDEIMVMFFEVKKPSDSYDCLFAILSRKLQALDLDITQYLSIEQVYEGMTLSPDDFFPVAEALFNCPTREISDDFYKCLNADPSSPLDQSEIVQKVREVFEVYVPPKVNTMVLSTIHQDLNLAVDEYYADLQNLKSVLSEEDFFDKRYMVDGKIKKQKWHTIFNNELACLRTAYEIVKDLEQGKKWSDPEFGPTENDEFGSKSMYFADNDIPDGCPDPKDVKWLRPEEILGVLIDNGNDDLQGKQADVFSLDGATANDVCQSKYLGNCWFVSALSIIARYDIYLRGDFNFSRESVEDLSDEEIRGMQMGVYPPSFQFLRKYGIYVMRFYKNFAWRYVMIDDRLCFKDDDFVYGKCKSPTELWVNLIEKAYAKIHNCYSALTSGDIAQGLADMTGLTGDKRRIEKENLQKPEDKDKLWDLLVKNTREGTMMGCSSDGGTEHYIQVDDEDTGLMSGHAYGIINVFEIKDEQCKNYHRSHRLLIIRNPWGYGEWKLKWADGSEKLEQCQALVEKYQDEFAANAKNKEEAEELKYKFGVDDGTFLMCFKDWRNIFTNLFACINFPEEFSGWRGKDRFFGQTGGVPKKTEQSLVDYAQKNPQYILELKKKSLTFIQLKQLDGRLFWGEKYPYPNIMQPILVCLFKLGPNEKALTKFDQSKMIASSGKVNLRREVDTDYKTLEPGRYAIIPCTLEPGAQCEYSINVYFDCKREDISVQKFGDPTFQFQIIQELEEEYQKESEDYKKLLKKQALDVVAAQPPSQSNSPLKQTKTVRLK